MIITVELPPDVEVKLRETAARHDVERVRQVLREALAPTVEATVTALLRDSSPGVIPHEDGMTEAAFEALADELANMSPALPLLPDDAVNRAGIYEDHP